MTVNAEAINELADVIESEQFLFDMNIPFIATCASPGCIGGTAAAIWPDVKAKISWDPNAWDRRALAKKLGVDIETECSLTYPSGYFADVAAKDKDEVIADPDDDYITADIIEYFGYGNLTRAGVVKTLRRLAETGKVEWHRKEHV